jgi:hypothetical protein
MVKIGAILGKTLTPSAVDGYGGYQGKVERRPSMTMDESEIKGQTGSNEQAVRFRRTHEKVKAWSYATDRIELLLSRLRSELSNSRVADDFDPEVVQDLRKIQSQMNRIKQEIRWIEMSLEEILAIEREWWKK